MRKSRIASVMQPSLNRREFLRLSAVFAGLAAVGCTPAAPSPTAAPAAPAPAPAPAAASPAVAAPAPATSPASAPAAAPNASPAVSLAPPKPLSKSSIKVADVGMYTLTPQVSLVGIAKGFYKEAGFENMDYTYVGPGTTH